MTAAHDAGSSPLSLQLWYGDLLVAEVSNVIVHQGTWFGDYKQVVTREQGKQATRLCDYIAFDGNWHKRLKHGKNPDQKQFEHFKDVLYSGMWRVKCPDGSELTMVEGPGFVAVEVCWNHPENEPTREEAARKVWCRLSDRCT
jgi:hypothetical protein